MFLQLPIMGVEGGFDLMVKNGNIAPSNLKLKRDFVICLSTCQPDRVYFTVADREEDQGISANQ